MRQVRAVLFAAMVLAAFGWALKASGFLDVVVQGVYNLYNPLPNI